jgi:hypothetical protein
MNISLKTLGIYIGIFFGLVFIVLSFCFWKMGPDAYVGFLWYSTWMPVLFLGLGIAGWIWRQSTGLVLPFKVVLQYAFIAYLVYEVAYAGVTVILYDFIDKSLYYNTLKISLIHTKERMAQLHLPDVDIQEAIRQEQQDENKGFTLAQVGMGIAQSILWDFMKSVLIAIVIQRKVPSGQDALVSIKP